MDNIEITVFDEIKDYKEKIYFFNFRQWIFAILIIIAVVPTYLILKEKIIFYIERPAQKMGRPFSMDKTINFIC